MLCSKCGQDKLPEEFHVRRNRSRGHEYRCKKCERLRRYKKVAEDPTYKKRENERVRRRREENPENYRESGRRADVKRYGTKKRNARLIAAYRSRSGQIYKAPCAICGNLKVQGHHCDYNKPLDIMWMCRDHHRAWHRVFLAEE